MGGWLLYTANIECGVGRTICKMLPFSFSKILSFVSWVQQVMLTWHYVPHPLLDTASDEKLGGNLGTRQVKPLTSYKDVGHLESFLVPQVTCARGVPPYSTHHSVHTMSKHENNRIRRGGWQLEKLNTCNNDIIGIDNTHYHCQGEVIHSRVLSSDTTTWIKLGWE